MLLLIIGLFLFIGVHSVRIVADGWRARQIERLGLNTWKGIYSLASLVGLVCIVWGYGMARQMPLILWEPPPLLRSLAALLVLPAFVLMAAAYVPRNHMKAAVGHPMVAGVKVWAFAHLISNGWVNDVLLFGVFLAWAILAFRSLRRRDRQAGTAWTAGTVAGDAGAVAAGLALWAAFAFYLHGLLIGVPLY